MLLNTSLAGVAHLLWPCNSKLLTGEALDGVVVAGLQVFIASSCSLAGARALYATGLFHIYNGAQCVKLWQQKQAVMPVVVWK